MSDPTARREKYKVRVAGPGNGIGKVVFRFESKECGQGPGAGDAAGLGRRVVVTASPGENGPVLHWSGSPDVPGEDAEEIRAEVMARMRERADWLHLIESLVAQVNQWARELGWATRRVDKRLEDDRIGEHRVPALVMQEDTCRIMLEPVGRLAPGSEAVVDLYLMPAYDDIARLYYHGGQWHLHYVYNPRSPGIPTWEAPAAALTKETLERVLKELRAHAA